MKYKIVIETGCWEFDGPRNNGGYGYFYVKRKQILVHRQAFIDAFGPIPDGYLVCHRCDNPPCINPEHLFTGTIGDNNRDCHAKSRAHFSKGHRFNTGRKRLRKLTDEEVLFIKKSRWQLKPLAQKFDVSISTISFIRNGKRKQLVTAPEKTSCTT